MATLEELEAALRAADDARKAAEAAGDVQTSTRHAENARALAAAYRQASNARTVEKAWDPTEGMSEWDKGVVGFGKAFVDLGRGLGQHARRLLPEDWSNSMGLPTTSDIEEARKYDAPLMKNTSAKIGNAVGTGAAFVPFAAMPGANTYAGSAALGALAGAAQPFTSTDEFLQNTATGGVGGAGGLAAGRGAGALYQAGKAALSPFFQSGQRAIVRDTLHGFASDPAAAAQALRQAPPSTIPNATQTVAEAARDRGLAQLERSILNNPQYSQHLAAVRGNSQVARIAALEDIAGDAGKMDLYTGMRRELAREMYEPLVGQPIDINKVTPWIKGEITQLKKAPAIQAAMEKAKEFALNETRRLDENSMLRGLHYTKQALDDMIEAAKPQEALRLKSLKTRLVTVMDKMTDDAYSAVTSQYSELSKPINQMQIGQELLKRAQPNQYLRGTEVGIRPDAFSRAMSQPDRTASAATGYAKANMERTMDPEQMATLNEIGRQFAGRAFAEGAGRASGSNTAQNLVSQNFLRQTMGPFGLPQGWTEGIAQSTLGQSLMRPGQWAARIGEDRVMPTLADIMADPQRAAALLAEANQRTVSQRIGNEIDRFLPMMGLGYNLPAD